MQPASDATSYRDDPIGMYLAMPSAVVFCARPTLWGFALWGKPTAAEIRQVLPLLELELGPSAVPHASLVDARRLESADPRAFDVLTKYLAKNFDAFRVRVTRLAVVRPGGALGAMTAGFFEVAGAPYPFRVFEDLAAASTWVRGATLAAELDSILATATQVSPAVMQLRQWLDNHLHDASLARAARAVSRAPRSLQRDLGAARTSFQEELDAARVRIATPQLTETESSVTEIAYDVGCASPQHFSTMFKRFTGKTPMQWRLAARRRP